MSYKGPYNIGEFAGQGQETVAAVAGQTTVTLNNPLGNIIPEVYIDGYCSIDRIFDFTVTSSNTITLHTPLEMNGNIYIVNKGSV